uniref:Serine/threonine/tyrosine interacting like 1 n=1 Tax=Pseudonaja textilis TaxID=8673 RepID=A0A670Y2I2_PSETE
MAGVTLCEPTELYNLLNQSTKISRLAEPNYLCLLDARTKREYNESHLMTALRVKTNPLGKYLVPESINLECVRYCVVYDGKTETLMPQINKYFVSTLYSLNDLLVDAKEGSAARCARIMQRLTRFPVMVLRGGYERFTTSYHYLRTQKIFWMPQELEAFKTYPVEILPAKLYMGNYKQACDSQIQKDLKIKAHINICEEDDAHIHKGAVLVFSTLGISRCSTAVMAYLIHSCKLYLKVSVKCKNNIRPNRAFVKQLSDWEQRFYITAITDISEPNY